MMKSIVFGGLVPLLMLAALGHLVYYDYLDAYFMSDDLSVLRIATLDSNSPSELLMPMQNGFWRPLILLTGFVLASLFEMNPVPYHLIILFVHILNAVIVGTLVRYCTTSPFNWRWGVISYFAAILFLTHNLSWYATAQFQNICDTYLCLFSFITIILWALYLKHDDGLYYMASLLALFLTLGSKETGIMLIAVLVAMGIILFDETLWSSLSKLKMHLLISVLFFGFIVGMQMTRDASYSSEGFLGFAPLALANKFSDSLYTLAFPFATISTLEIINFSIYDSSIVILRVVMGFLFLLLFLGSHYGKNDALKPVQVFLIGAVLFLLPSLLIPGKPVGRYLYVPLAFAIIAAVVAFEVQSNTFAKGVMYVAGSAFIILNIYSLANTLEFRDYNKTANHMKHFASQFQLHAADYNKSSKIYFINHPHPQSGSLELKWVYAQHLTDLLFPGKDFAVMLEPAVTPDECLHYHKHTQTLYDVDCSVVTDI